MPVVDRIVVVLERTRSDDTQGMKETVEAVSDVLSKTPYRVRGAQQRRLRIRVRVPVMPLKGVRYRVVKRGGKKIRLALRGKKTVVEATNLETGATHTPAEFRRDRARRRKKRRRY